MNTEFPFQLHFCNLFAFVDIEGFCLYSQVIDKSEIELLPYPVKPLSHVENNSHSTVSVALLPHGVNLFSLISKWSKPK